MLYVFGHTRVVVHVEVRGHVLGIGSLLPHFWVCMVLYSTDL